MSHQTQWKRVALYGLIGAVVVSALLGIGTLVFGQLDETTAKVLFSTLSVSFFGTTGLICAAAWAQTTTHIRADIRRLLQRRPNLRLIAPPGWIERNTANSFGLLAGSLLGCITKTCLAIK